MSFSGWFSCAPDSQGDEINEQNAPQRQSKAINVELQQLRPAETEREYHDENPQGPRCAQGSPSSGNRLVLGARSQIPVYPIYQHHARREHKAEKPGVYIGCQNQGGELAGGLETSPEKNAEQQRAAYGNAGKSTMTMREGFSQAP